MLFEETSIEGIGLHHFRLRNSLHLDLLALGRLVHDFLGFASKSEIHATTIAESPDFVDPYSVVLDKAEDDRKSNDGDYATNYESL